MVFSNYKYVENGDVTPICAVFDDHKTISPLELNGKQYAHI
jgi:hypothetical protein